MADDSSYQTSLSSSEQSNRNEDDFKNLPDQKTVSGAAVDEMKFRSVMGQHEMEILATLFPKCAQTLAEVLRNRPHRFDDEL